MKKNRFAASVFTAGALFAGALTLGQSALTTFAAGWSKEGTEWYYLDNSGDYVTDTWKLSGDYYFYLGDDGMMMRSSFVDDGTNLYYVNKDGARVTGTWGYLEDHNGDEEEYWYYFQSNGKAKKDGYLTINGVRYHFTDYHLDEGWQEDSSGNTYYYTANISQSGWHYITDSYDDKGYEEGWYYTDANGKLLKNCEKKINGKSYAFDENGRMQEGFTKVATSEDTYVYKYYKPEAGNRVDGWYFYDSSRLDDEDAEREDGWYYFKNGIAYATDYKTTKISDKYGIAKIGSRYYCFDKNGLMQSGVVKGDNGTIFYFGAPSDGSMKTGRVKVEYDDNYDYEGSYMYFNTTGDIAVKGNAFTGVKSNYLYKNGEPVVSDDGWELVTVDGSTYIVNENGKLKTSGTFKDDNDVTWVVSKRADGKGYQITKK